MTLIELIGVLAVIAVLVVLTFGFTVRHLDQIASDREVAALTTIGNALEKYIIRARRIPNFTDTDWASVVAAEAGVNTKAVTNNFRQCRRVLWVDRSGWLSTNLPYVQTYQSATNIAAAPANARMMLISTISGNLPGTVTSGMPTAAEFANVWNGTIPSWSGVRAEDVKVHRINLAPLFARLVLSTYFSPAPGQFALDGAPSSPPYLLAPYSNGVSGYFLKGTAVQLHTNVPTVTSAPQLTHILQDDASFVFENGFWKNSITGGRTLGAGSSMGIVAAFLAARPNTNAQYSQYNSAVSNQQQVLIVDAFIRYMSNYNRWVYTNMTPAERVALQTYMQRTNQPQLMDLVHGLYTRGNDGVDHFPTNDVIWPPL